MGSAFPLRPSPRNMNTPCVSRILGHGLCMSKKAGQTGHGPQPLRAGGQEVGVEASPALSPLWVLVEPRFPLQWQPAFLLPP